MQERQMDIDQMLTNTINVGSWLLLNALMPAALPEAVTKQYKDQFVDWPPISSEAQWAVMFPAVKSLRASIKTLVECQLSRQHLQPLTELCTTIRLKCLGMLVEKGKEAIIALGPNEDWRIDLVAEPPRTELPDRFETEVNELMADLKYLMSSGNFPGETDLFIKEKWRQMIIDLFTVLLLGIRDCYDLLLRLRHRDRREPPNKAKRPNTLSDSASMGSADEEGAGGKKPTGTRKQPAQEQMSRKFMVAIANIDFVVGHSLPGICRRLGENGLKFSDQVFKRSKDKLVAYRNSLLAHYTNQKAAQIYSILEAANYSHLPDEDDVSDFVKELMLCAVFVQAEMASYCAQFTQQVLSDLVKIALERLFDSLARVDFSSSEYATQVIIDLTAFEEAFQAFVTPEMSSALKSIRARLMNRLDNSIFRNALQNYRSRMAMAMESLQQYQNKNNNSSNPDADSSGRGTSTTTAPHSSGSSTPSAGRDGSAKRRVGGAGGGLNTHAGSSSNNSNGGGSGSRKMPPLANGQVPRG